MATQPARSASYARDAIERDAALDVSVNHGFHGCFRITRIAQRETPRQLWLA